jgi:hypothetical protein
MVVELVCLVEEGRRLTNYRGTFVISVAVRYWLLLANQSGEIFILNARLGTSEMHHQTYPNMLCQKSKLQTWTKGESRTNSSKNERQEQQSARCDLSKEWKGVDCGSENK